MFRFVNSIKVLCVLLLPVVLIFGVSFSGCWFGEDEDDGGPFFYIPRA